MFAIREGDELSKGDTVKLYLDSEYEIIKKHITVTSGPPNKRKKTKENLIFGYTLRDWGCSALLLAAGAMSIIWIIDSYSTNSDNY